MNEQQSIIKKQRDRWIAAINDGSANDFIDVLTDDVVWLPSQHDALSGKEQIRAWLEKPFTELRYDYAVSEIYMRIAGGWAIEQAKFSTRVWANADQAMPPHEGSYTLLWRKTSEDKWLIERYIDHSADFVEES